VTHLRRLLCVLLLVTAAMTACTDSASADPEPGHHGRRGSQQIEPGRGVFTFDGYPPLADHPVRVWYDAPADPSTAQILIVMHGVGRNGADYRDDWHDLVDGRNVLVLAPEFSDKEYPDAEAYSLGNIIDRHGDRLPNEQWSFHVVEALFDHVVRTLGSTATDYAMFGHSAGAQFVARFVTFMPKNRARIAVAANAGWYTTLDDSVKFPYGLDGSSTREDELHAAFASNLVILLGSNDTDGEDDSLRRDDGSDQQGRNRLERGMNFYQQSQDVAARESLPFAWRLTVVPGIAHSHADMAAAAAPMLLR